MSCKRNPLRIALLGFSVLALAACSPASRSPEVAYKRAESERSLETPPDLRRDRAADGSSIPEAEEDQRVLPDFENVRLERAGPSVWLELPKAQAEELWPELQAFVRSQGLRIENEQRATGIIQTAWNRRLQGPQRTGISGWISGFFSNNETEFSDRYQFRLERGDAGEGVRIFVVHRTAQQLQRGQGGTNQEQGLQWQLGGTDPAISAEMQRRLLVYLGMREQRANEIAQAGDNGEADFGAAYRTDGDVGAVDLDEGSREEARGRVSDALDQVGARIDEVDAGSGTYLLSWFPPDAGGDDGFFGLLGEDEPQPEGFVLQLRRRSDGDGFLIVASSNMSAFDAEQSGFAGVPASGNAERALLQRLADALNGIDVRSAVGDSPSMPDEAPTSDEGSRAPPGNLPF